MPPLNISAATVYILILIETFIQSKGTFL